MYKRNAGLPDAVINAVMNVVYVDQLTPEEMYNAVQYGTGPHSEAMKDLDKYFRDHPYELEKFAEYVINYDIYVRLEYLRRKYDNAVDRAKYAKTPYEKAYAEGQAWGIAVTLDMLNYAMEGIEIPKQEGDKTP